MVRAFLAMALVALLSACGSGRPVANDLQISQVRYQDPNPPAITLITSINSETGSGAHSALLIDASQRVIFDPAGNFRSAEVPQQGDVLYGLRPAALRAYLEFQSSKGYHVVAERAAVSPGVAERALQLARTNGAAMQGLCTDNVSSLVRKLPGFESLNVTLFPVTFMNEFARLPGVTRGVYVDVKLVSGVPVTGVGDAAPSSADAVGTAPSGAMPSGTTVPIN